MGGPSIAFSGQMEDKTPCNAHVPVHSRVYAELAMMVTEAVLSSGPPYLPEGTFLNVNFPEAYTGVCESTHQYRFVLTRNYHHFP
jgi:broad specificity polyphosphatase/5'/3'-nucleotidase SurE